MSGHRPITDSEIRQHLFSEGGEETDFVIVGPCSAGTYLICQWHPSTSRYLQLLIEDDEVYAACIQYLKSHGARSVQNSRALEALGPPK